MKIGLILLPFLSLSPAMMRAEDSHNPEIERALFKVADGFEVNLFASEKEGVIKPIQMRFDARGRLWVIGSASYPQIKPTEPPNDNIVILEDRDGDGRCDKSVVFADGLAMPTGIELGDGGAYVGAGSQLLFLRDNNGDGRADERRVVLRGFGTGDTHQTINSFLWDDGGKLWMCQGLHAFSRVETPWGIARLEQAGLWRFHPQRQRLEGFFGSAHEPQNPWGLVFTDWGEPIAVAGNNSTPLYAAAGMTSNRRPEQPPTIWKEGRYRKSSGGDIVGTTHFPDDWQGRLLFGGYFNNAVWTLQINDDGAGFGLTDLPPLITSSSPSFRPVDVKFGPDGALYICDWYNPIIGHYQASFRHPDRDKAHGRIWRVTAKNRALTKPPRLHDVPLPQLLEHLKSTDRWTRHFAKRALADLPADKVIPALKKWCARPDLSEHALKEALGIFQSHEVVEPKLLARLALSADPGARAYAASVIGDWADRLPDPLALSRPLVADKSPRVRLRAVVAASHVPKAEAIEVAAIAADLPTDPFLDYALRQTVFSLKPYWRAPFQAGQLKFDNRLARLALLVRADGTPDTLRALRDLASSPALDAASRETFLRLLADIGDANDAATILKLNDSLLQARLLPTVATAARLRNLRPAGDVVALLRPLIESKHEPLRAEALKLAGVWKLEEFRATAETIAASSTASDPLRRAALESLANYHDVKSRDTLFRLALENSPIQHVAIARLADLDLTAATPLAADWLSRADGSDSNELFIAFLQRKGGAQALAQALKAKPPARDAAKLGLRLLNSSGRRDEALATLLTAAAGFTSEPKRLSAEQTKTLITEIKSRGNTARGAEIFRRAELGCVNCHSIGGQGGKIGPDLSALGTAQPLDIILSAILDPQKEIKEGYITYEIATKDGEEYQGYILQETRNEIRLQDNLQQREIRLRTDRIAAKTTRGSAMPAGLADTLTHGEFIDLLHYLSELGKPK